MNFNNFIRFGIKIYITTSGKKNKPTHPKKWQELVKSKYNGEDNFAVLTGKINDRYPTDYQNFLSKVVEFSFSFVHF
ncbi:MAG: hypothetical protein PHX34_04475 [Candidatus Shapirobacteria bacterium]|nr:hypothetical protein [Candidatus Shapirobacteria bacterium]